MYCIRAHSHWRCTEKFYLWIEILDVSVSLSFAFAIHSGKSWRTQTAFGCLCEFVQIPRPMACCVKVVAGYGKRLFPQPNRCQMAFSHPELHLVSHCHFSFLHIFFTAGIESNYMYSVPSLMHAHCPCASTLHRTHTLAHWCADVLDKTSWCLKWKHQDKFPNVYLAFVGLRAPANGEPNIGAEWCLARDWSICSWRVHAANRCKR